MSNARPFRYEWDGTVRRLKLPPLVKLVAAYVSQYADNEGRNTRPGVERLALETQTSAATVKRCLKRLRELGLLELVRSGSSQGRRAKANEYRLAIPADLLERVELVTEVNVGEPNRDHQESCDPAPGETPESTDQGSPDEPCSDGTGLTDDTNRDHLVSPYQPETTPADNTTPDINSLPAPTLTPREADEVDNPKIHNPPNCSPQCTFCAARRGRVIPFRARRAS